MLKARKAKPTKDVALVLSSGGPRGFAYIGAIEELLSRGYSITSVAGSSIGSLVGGLYAAGGLDTFKEWLFSLGNFQIMKMIDISIGRNYLLKGEKIISAIREIVPEVRIEDMAIPFKAVATDLHTGESVIFDKGDLYTAIRASISIPSLFKPVKVAGRTLIDGGLSSTFPLSIVSRSSHDILIGFDVNEVQPPYGKAHRNGRAAEGNYLNTVTRSFDLMNHTIAALEKRLCPPDVLVNLNLDEYVSLLDYTQGEEISKRGRSLMRKALDSYEAAL